MALTIIKSILAMAIAMAITVALFRNINIYTDDSDETTPFKHPIEKETLEPAVGNKRKSRFLVEKLPKLRNPNAADHCNKDESVCGYYSNQNSTMACCSNKCVDLVRDEDNCGACKNKCKFTQTCCRGECVYLAYDKRHCGECNSPCRDGEYCVYGMCNYA